MKHFNLAFVLLFLAACQQDQPATQQLERASFTVQELAPEQQIKTHQMAAFVVPTDQATMSFQVSGLITEQMIKIGDAVNTGENLFKITNPSLAPQIEQFQSQIEAINATLEQNHLELERVSTLQAQQAVSQNDLDRLNNERDNLQANKRSLEAQLAQAQSMFEETILKAPFDGNIADIYKETGEFINPGEAILLVGGVSSLEAPLYLPAYLHSNLTHGQQLQVKYHEHGMQATIKEISQSANPKSQLFKVMIDVPIEHNIKSGEKITVMIEEALGMYHRLPIESVIDDGINEPFVLLIENQKVQQVPITLIGIEGDQVIVNLGHNNTINVVTAGQVNLAPGQDLSQP